MFPVWRLMGNGLFCDRVWPETYLVFSRSSGKPRSEHGGALIGQRMMSRESSWMQTTHRSSLLMTK